jgi:putative ABC transport system permease protein
VEQIIQEGTDGLHGVPGIIDAGVSNCLPMAGGFEMTFDVVGRPNGNSPFTGRTGFCSISYGYFNTLKIPLLRAAISRNWTMLPHPA